MPEQTGTETGIIAVEVSAEHDLEADHADAVVEVKASAFFTGAAAFTNAKELAALVRGLEELGVPRTAFSLQGVQAETNEGLLTRSSSATYTVLIRLEQLERVGDVLAACTTLKQATLRELRWGYSREPVAQQEWMEALAAESVKKARRVAAGLGVKLGALHRFAERPESPNYSLRRGDFLGSDDMAPRGSYGKGRVPLAITVTHRKRVQVMATAEFHTLPES
ncbi:hypothetical protein EJ065_1507 [Corallococcus coralloides]|uniref:SIMPL domain-containing protein n=1 Tax=Corallococcus coralloides TaxID=184914 RepID=A0A410RMD6_CORCK|nr:SIMPL domain-containing protein [Corallococcus coralloides]QAT83107.1 hypothetical protein EJ065_1507 [Corallococcus coralloides]